jgi:hypothetical protein
MGWGSAPRPGRLHPLERLGTHCTGGWVGPSAGLDMCGKSRPHRDSIPDRPARSQSLYRLSYPAHLDSNKFSQIYGRWCADVVRLSTLHCTVVDISVYRSVRFVQFLGLCYVIISSGPSQPSCTSLITRLETFLLFNEVGCRLEWKSQ